MPDVKDMACIGPVLATGYTMSEDTVVLGRVGRQVGSGPSRQPIWPIQPLEQVETITVDRSPIGEKCGLAAAASPRDGEESLAMCCKQLRGGDERHLVSPAVVRDV